MSMLRPGAVGLLVRIWVRVAFCYDGLNQSYLILTPSRGFAVTAPGGSLGFWCDLKSSVPAVDVGEPGVQAPQIRGRRTEARSPRASPFDCVVLQ